MKSIIFIIVLSCIATLAYAQQSYRDSLMALLSKTKEDTARVNLLSRLSDSYTNSNPDSQFLYAQEGLKIAQSVGYIKGEIECK